MNALTRRGFVGTGAAVLALAWRGGRVIAAPQQAARALNDWLLIGPDGRVTVRVNQVEMGQGAQTGMAQILADELDAPWESVRVEMAPIQAPFLTHRGQYMTGGSASIEQNIGHLRAMGAAGRDMLLRAGAARLGAAVGDCHAESGKVIHTASGRSLAYGTLVAEACALTPPAEPPLKDRSAWRLVGKPLPRIDLPSKVDGSAVYGLDVEVPGMKVATLIQCPGFGGKLAGVDEGPALKVAGVTKVVKLPNAVAVVADGYWAARTGLQALAPKWTPGRAAGVSSADISAKLNALAVAGGKIAFDPPKTDAKTALADNTAALAGAARRFEATYEVPLLAHATLEPMNATARVANGKAEIWAPTQVQSRMRRDVAKALGLREAAVELHTTQLGGGFGRRLETDYGVQAALIAREAGVPVKLIWGRDEDMRHDFYRPATVARLQAGLDADGMPVAFRADIACLDEGPFGGIGETPYGLPATYVAATTWNPGVPIGAWRSVDWTQNTFFVESFIDELAALGKADPVAYRLRLLKDNPRLTRLLAATAERAGWSKPPAAGRHRGVALCERGGTSCVEIVEIEPAGETPRVIKVTAGIDCGTAINPGQIRAQVEGGVIMALSAALRQQITIKDGAVEQAFFDSFPMVNMAEAPEIDTVILETPGAKVTGVGEPPVPPLPPALANAIFAATGKRIRRLPIAALKAA
jgi:isoquinoline 1-oxidoreductase beta subunit